MVANSIQRRVAIALESGSLDAPAALDYDSLAAPGGLFAITQHEDGALRRAYIENKTIPARAAEEPEKIPALRNEAMTTLGFYLAGQTSGHAAAGSPAVRDLTALVMRAGWSGQYLGVSADLTGGTAAAPEVTEGQGAGLGPYGWGYFWDADGGPAGTGAGYFRQVASVATPGGSPDVLTMAPDHDLPFVPQAGDRIYAVIADYCDWDVAEDHTAAGHELLRVFMAGRAPADYYELFGAKPEFQFGAIEQGSPTEVTMPVKCAYFEHHEVVLSPSLDAALQGAPGRVVGAGTSTRAYLSNIGTTLATQQFWGAMQFTPGVTPEQVKGPNGVEGVHGYGLSADSYKGTRLELAVPFDIQLKTDAANGTQKRFMVQVGNAPSSGPWAIYCPRLSWDDDPETGAESNSRRQQTLRFACLEAQRNGQPGAVDTTGLTDAEATRALAKFVILRIA